MIQILSKIETLEKNILIGSIDDAYDNAVNRK